MQPKDFAQPSLESEGAALPADRPNNRRDEDGADDTLDLRELLDALHAVRMGDFSARLPAHLTGLSGKVADTFNEIVGANARMA